MPRLTNYRDDDSAPSFVATPREVQLLELKRRLIAPVRRGLDAARGRTSLLPAPPVIATPYTGPSDRLDVGIEELSYYRGILRVAGWVSSNEVIVGVGYVSPGDTAIRAMAPDDRGAGLQRHDFAFDIEEADRNVAMRTRLSVEFASGDVLAVSNLGNRALDDDPVFALNRRFQKEVRKLADPRILEVGSRARSGNIYREWLPVGATYVGCDILPGDNVDVVGDAHNLSSLVPVDHFDAIFSQSTMEHLAMPWIVAAEMNRVLRPGGVVYVASHQCWPVHEAPWDFYRFSEYSWATLFNRYSGFEIVEVAAGERGKVVADVLHPATSGLELQPAFLSSAVLAHKIAPTDLRWAADATSVVQDTYPV